jgi:hypothetical protein
MKILSRIRFLAFLVVLVGSLLTATGPAAPVPEEPCPPYWCDMMFCQFGANYYWQFPGLFQCTDANCQCEPRGACTRDGSDNFKLCWCEECEEGR